MTLFDRYVVVDWSAKSVPATGADSIWIADLRGRDAPELHNPATRASALGILEHLLDRQRGRRTLLGFDASLGYPAGSAALFGLEGVPWLAMWHRIAQLVNDDDRNRNDRFRAAAALNADAGPGEGPFWGATSDEFAPALRRTKPPTFPVSEFRTVERVLVEAGRRPKSCWQLLGAGSVGGQTLTLLPRLCRLADRLVGRLSVWPLDTGLRVPDTEVVVAEVWPSMFVTPQQARPRGRVVDEAQVVGTAAALAEADRTGELRSWFAPTVTESRRVVTEEGWILGVAGEAEDFARNDVTSDQIGATLQGAGEAPRSEEPR